MADAAHLLWGLAYNAGGHLGAVWMATSKIQKLEAILIGWFQATPHFEQTNTNQLLWVLEDDKQQ